MVGVAARWIDCGQLDPLDLHATYTGLAEAQAPDASPLVLISRPSRAHLSIGASQSARADLDLERCKAQGIAVVQRPLGGGSVWVDPSQTVICLVFPWAHSPGRPAAVFDTALQPLLRVFSRFGIEACRVGQQDIWAGNRKILGSGAGTVGRSLVFATSILRRFDAEGFAQCIRAPSEGFRHWLGAALAEGMTDWQSEGGSPDDDALLPVLREALSEAFGWSLTSDEPTREERAAVAEARMEIGEPIESDGPRHIRHGIKINQRRYLLEDQSGLGDLRLIVNDGLIDRLWVSDVHVSDRMQACVGQPVDRFRLEDSLASAGFDAHEITAYRDRIIRMTADIPFRDETT